MLKPGREAEIPNGKRPAAARAAQEGRVTKQHWLGDPMLDRVMQVVVELAKELYVTRDRLQVIERLLDERGAISRTDIESWDAGADDDEEMRRARDEFVAKILAPVVSDPSG